MLDTHTEVVERPGALALPPFTRVDRVPRRRLRLRRRPRRTRAARRVVYRAGRADRGHRRPQRRRQDHAGQPAAAVLRRHRAARSLIDGLDVRDVTLASLRRQIGIVTQETVLFDDTDRRQHRLRHARRDAWRQIEAAARAAHAHDFIQRTARPATRRASASAGSGCPAASGSGWPSPGPCCRCADPGARRGHLGARRRVRAAGAGRAGEADAEPHLVRHRPPAVDRAAAPTPSSCFERGRHRRGRAARGTAGRPTVAYARLYQMQFAEGNGLVAPRPACRRPDGGDREDGPAMMKSMTGFASVTRDDERGSLSVTMRAVNHRFLDLQLRLPPLVADARTAGAGAAAEAAGARPRRGAACRCSCAAGRRRWSS